MSFFFLSLFYFLITGERSVSRFNFSCDSYSSSAQFGRRLGGKKGVWFFCEDFAGWRRIGLLQFFTGVEVKIVVSNLSESLKSKPIEDIYIFFNFFSLSTGNWEIFIFLEICSDYRLSGNNICHRLVGVFLKLRYRLSGNNIGYRLAGVLSSDTDYLGTTFATDW